MSTKTPESTSFAYTYNTQGKKPYIWTETPITIHTRIFTKLSTNSQYFMAAIQSYERGMKGKKDGTIRTDSDKVRLNKAPRTRIFLFRRNAQTHEVVEQALS